MTPDSRSLEADLLELQAVALDDRFLLRLEAAVEGSFTQLTPAEIGFEAALRSTAPAKLSADFLARLETVVQQQPFALNEKIVLFPKARNIQEPPQTRHAWRAVAAVSLIAAASALWMPAAKTSSTLAVQTATTSAPTYANSSNFVPASFNRGLSEVHDEGIVWKSNKQPHSLVRVVYQDKITLKDAAGRTVQVEQPRIEYLLVPAQTD